MPPKAPSPPCVNIASNTACNASVLEYSCDKPYIWAMIDIRPSTWTLLATVFVLNLAATAHARDLYRYTNDEGNIVVDDRVPTEYASRGYEVLNEEGIVLKVVPRKATEKEMEQLDIQEQLAATAAAEEERLRQWDETLLLRYSTIEDIEAARERELQDLRIRVSILKSNTRFLKQQVESHQAAAANIERNGGTVDVRRLSAIEDLQAEIVSTERSIADREEEVSLAKEKFQQDIDRFQMLLEVVALRRNSAVKKE